MSDVGVLTEQGFPVENAGLGFKPVKEDGFNPFNNKEAKSSTDGETEFKVTK